jgi:hypothetical protein
MVRKLEVADEEFYQEGARALLFNVAEEISNVMCLDGAVLKKCGVNQRPECIGYYVEYQGNIVAYFIVKKRCWPNFFGLEACRGWVCPALRGKGLYPILRKAAAGNSCLISDIDGMTERAYKSWITDPNFEHSFFELQGFTYSESEQIDEAEKFSEGALGGNWHLVLTPKT